MQLKSIYLDHGASTPVHPQVLEVMVPYWTEYYGNPSSHHAVGRAAGRALQEARETIAELLGAQPSEIVFTGCGSESDNLALRGAMFAARTRERGNHLIISAIEHSAISNTARLLVDQFGFELTVLPVDRYGQIEIEALEAAIRADTVLISIMAANNEIGTLQPVEAIGRLARRHKVLFHTDAVQAVAVQRWDLSKMPIDLLSVAPHKFYGPKGIGILYVREGLDLLPQLTGGGQEGGWRAGTENVPYAVGAARALRLAQDHLPEIVAHYLALRDPLIDGILDTLPEVSMLTGHPQQRLPHHASFAFRNISGNDLLMHLDMAGIAASSGSACKSGNPRPAAVLQALGLGPEWTKGGLRLTVGQQNTLAEIDYVIDTLPGIVKKLQQLEAQFS